MLLFLTRKRVIVEIIFCVMDLNMFSVTISYKLKIRFVFCYKDR